MNLSLDEGKLFYDLYAAILSFVNQKLDVAPEQFSSLAEYMSVSPEVRLAIRDALFDKRELIDEFITENPAQLIDRAFGVAESTGQGKSKSIRTMLKIGNFDLRWTLPSKKDANPRAWIVQVNGFAIDARYAPRDIQEAAFKKGLIP